ncbi:MAG TPA: tRNA-dependent cyclodipeptide synthase [Planctomycetes bacterium]|nr:tRNA-dependent cyclodipeptide synthase [Planctomycetota bacterium]
MTSDLNFENLDLPSISIVRTTPKVSEDELFSHQRCYMGISLDNPGFQGKNLQALLLWALGNFDKCLVVVGDHLCRFNEQIYNTFSRDEATEAALRRGDLFMDKASRFFQQIPAKRLVVKRWQRCLRSGEYKRARGFIDDLFASDDSFRASVERDAFSFLKRQARRSEKPIVSTEEAIELSCRYILEEITVFAALAEQGWEIELYPGPELGVLVDIAKGRYLRIPQGLTRRINVELAINPSGAG